MFEFEIKLDDDTSKALREAFDKIDREDFAEIMKGNHGFTLIDTKGNTSDFNAIVRCKDCKYYKAPDCLDTYGWMCELIDRTREETDYCSYGERKDRANGE